MNGIRGKFTSHREAVQDMKPLAAVNYLLGIIETAQIDNSQPMTVEMAVHGYTPQEAIVLNTLLRSKGDVCPREHLMGAICRGRSEHNWPTEKILDVRIYHIRKKLPMGFSIQNIRGIGYRLIRQPGALLPWEMR